MKIKSLPFAIFGACCLLYLGGFVSLMELHFKFLYMAGMVIVGGLFLLASHKYNQEAGGYDSSVLCFILGIWCIVGPYLVFLLYP